MHGPERTPLQRWRDSFRRRERLWIWVWLVVAFGTLGAFAVYGIALQNAERWVDRWNDRWSDRLAQCEEAFAAGRVAETLPELLELDREHPARTTVHARDKERERILTLLGHAWIAAGKKSRALETLDRLVSFDPLNWQNHFERAEARRRLREPEAALEGYADVLALHPSHLPSVQATIEMHSDAGRHAEVASAFEAYLDSWHLAQLQVELDETPAEGAQPAAALVAVLDVPADAQSHRRSIPLDLPAGWRGQMRIATQGYSIERPTIRMEPRALAGESQPGIVRAFEDFRALAGQLDEGTFRAETFESELAVDLVAPTSGGGRLVIELAVYKAVDAETWKRVQTAYRNLVDEPRFLRARQRTRVGGCLEGGSIVQT